MPLQSQLACEAMVPQRGPLTGQAVCSFSPKTGCPRRYFGKFAFGRCSLPPLNRFATVSSVYVSVCPTFDKCLTDVKVLPLQSQHACEAIVPQSPNKSHTFFPPKTGCSRRYFGHSAFRQCSPPPLNRFASVSSVHVGIWTCLSEV